MPGIDLVDLSDPLLKERKQNAMRLITHPDDLYPDHLVFWLLWTAKEAIFKLQRQLIRFSPKEIPVQIQEENQKIIFKSHSYNGFFIIENNIIVAIASKSDESVDYQILPYKSTNPSEEIRNAAIKYLSDNYNVDSEITSDEYGLPVFSLNKQPISFTHHHHFMGFAFDANLFKNSLPH